MVGLLTASMATYAPAFAALSLPSALEAVRLVEQAVPQLDLISDPRVVECFMTPLQGALEESGDLTRLGLPEYAVFHLEGFMAGSLGDKEDIVRSLSMWTSRLGAIEAGHVILAEERHDIPVEDAINGLFGSLRFTSKQTGAIKLSRMKDPRKGFSPFRTDRGTEVAFFPTAESLGEPWKQLVQRHWRNGFGLVLFRNQKSRTAGMVFIHTLGRVAWSQPTPNAWYAAGPTQYVPLNVGNFGQALKMVMDDGSAMTWKWRTVEQSLIEIGLDRQLGLGGSSGLLFYHIESMDREAAISTYAEVLEKVGVTLTWTQRDADPSLDDLLANLAPYSVLGNAKSVYGGMRSTSLEAIGILYGIGSLLNERYPGRKDISILIQGQGFLGKTIAQGLRKGGYDHISFVGHDYDQNLSKLTRSLEKLIIFTAGTGSMTFNAVPALIFGGILVAMGARVNQLQQDRDGSFEPLARILQSAGILYPADFVLTQMGAMAVASKILRLDKVTVGRLMNHTSKQMSRQHHTFLRGGIAPHLYEWEKARRLWRVAVINRKGIGGVSFR